jgi:type IV secretory pathway VirD2 relaxase
MTEKEKLQEARDLVWQAREQLEWENVNNELNETLDQKIDRWLVEGWKPTLKE